MHIEEEKWWWGVGIAQMQSEHHGCLDLAVFLGLRKVVLSYELQQKQSFVGLPVRRRDEWDGHMRNHSSSSLP